MLKSVVETIPTYWMTLAFITKGVLDKLRNRFRFLWSGRMDTRGIPLVKRERLAIPKDFSHFLRWQIQLLLQYGVGNGSELNS